ITARLWPKAAKVVALRTEKKNAGGKPAGVLKIPFSTTISPTPATPGHEPAHSEQGGSAGRREEGHFRGTVGRDPGVAPVEGQFGEDVEEGVDVEEAAAVVGDGGLADGCEGGGFADHEAADDAAEDEVGVVEVHREHLGVEVGGAEGVAGV